MESLDVVYGSLERCALFRRNGISRDSKFFLGYSQAFESNAIEAFRIRTERSVTALADCVHYFQRDGRDVSPRLLCRAG
jgi:hypothetical protein